MVLIRLGVLRSLRGVWLLIRIGLLWSGVLGRVWLRVLGLLVYFGRRFSLGLSLGRRLWLRVLRLILRLLILRSLRLRIL